jgi:hypothetical protein
MDKDTKVLLMAVVIILVALVSFNLSDLTGKVIKSDTTTISVSPISFTFGKHDHARMMTIRVSPGKNGIDKRLVMVESKRSGYDTQISSETVRICGDEICYDDVTISYRVDSGLKEGRYYFKGKRQNTGQVFTSNKFEISHE